MENLCRRVRYGGSCSLCRSFLLGTGTAKAVEYGEMVQTNGKWVWRSTEDPVLKLMRDKGVITNERYNEVSAQKGKNWIEPADAVLNLRRELEWTRYVKTATHLPDWIDLGFENRTRFESYDHPWRATQVRGRGNRCSVSPPIQSARRIGGQWPLPVSL